MPPGNRLEALRGSRAGEHSIQINGQYRICFRWKNGYADNLEITQTEFARRLDVSYLRLNEIIHGKRAVTPDTALRLAKVTGMSADFWLGLQLDWDLWHSIHSKSAKAIAKLKPIDTKKRARNR